MCKFESVFEGRVKSDEQYDRHEELAKNYKSRGEKKEEISKQLTQEAEGISRECCQREMSFQNYGCSGKSLL